MNIDYTVSVVLLPIFADSSVKQTSMEYYKALITNDNKVLSKKLSIFHKDIESCLKELYEECLKVDYEWSVKELLTCRKNDKFLEIIYSCKIPYFKDCNKTGKIVNIGDFSSLITDQYYVEIISATSPRFFR
jgi:hypothetical protein